MASDWWKRETARGEEEKVEVKEEHRGENIWKMLKLFEAVLLLQIQMIGKGGFYEEVFVY